MKNNYEKNLCLLITNTRSRSTYLLDIIRSNFNIGLDCNYDNYRKLYLHGRRYPLDLCNLTGQFNVTNIEVWKKEFSSIPILEPSLNYDYSIEKIHPHFIQLPYSIFKLLLLKRFQNVKIIYLIRDPKDSLKSFIRYGKNNPNWIKGKSIPDFITQQYQEIFKIHKQLGGMIIDNEQLDDLETLLIKISNYLGIDFINHNLNKFERFNQELYDLRKKHSSFVNTNQYIDLMPYQKALDKAYFFYDVLKQKKENNENTSIR